MSNPSLATSFALTEKQAIFVREKANGANNVAACLAAGYQTDTPDAVARSVLRSPKVLAALHIEVQRLIQDDASIARRVAMELLQDTATSDKIRADIAFKILDRAGHIAPRARAAGDGADKTLGEMSLDELKATQDRLQSEILARAKPVNAQSGAIVEGEAADLLG